MTLEEKLKRLKLDMLIDLNNRLYSFDCERISCYDCPIHSEGRCISVLIYIELFNREKAQNQKECESNGAFD